MDFSKYDIPNSLKNLLHVRGRMLIDSIKVCRVPLRKMVAIGANIVGLGQYSRAQKKLGYDYYYHLYIGLTLTNGTTIYLEKNQRIAIREISSNASIGANGTCIPVRMYPRQSATVNDFMANVFRFVKLDRLVRYDVVKQNCQVFVMDLLYSNGILDKATRDFVLQNVAEGVGSKVNWLVNQITDFGAFIDRKLDNTPLIDPSKTNLSGVNIIMSNQESIYIDVTTSALNRTSLVTGSKNSITVSLPQINLPNTEYLIQIVDFRYPTVDMTASPYNYSQNYAKCVTPLVQLEQCQSIIVNGRYGKLLYKALGGSHTADYLVDDLSQSPQIAVKVASNTLSNLNIAIVRSDDGTPYPFTEDENEGHVVILFQITPVTSPMIQTTSATSQ